MAIRLTLSIDRALLLAKSRSSRSMAMRLSAAGGTFLLNVLLVRNLGTTDYGRVGFVMAWLLLLAGVLRVGINSLITREIASYDELGERGKIHGLIRRSYQLIALISLGIIAIILGFTNIFSSWVGGNLSLLFMIGSPFVLFISLMSVTESITRGYGNVILGQVGEFFVRPISNLLVISLFLLFASSLFNSKLAIASYTASAILAYCTAWLLRPKQQIEISKSSAPEFDDRLWLKSAVSLSVLGWLSTLLMQSGPILVGLLSGPRDVAYLQVALQFVMVALLLNTVINSLVTPSVSRHFANRDIEAMQNVAHRSSRLSITFGLSMSLIVAVIGFPAIKYVFGIDNPDAYYCTIIILVGTLSNCLTGIVVQLILGNRLESHLISVIVASLVIVFLLSLILVPRYGAIGGAIAISVSEIVWNFCAAWILYKKTGIISLPFKYKTKHF